VVGENRCEHEVPVERMGDLIIVLLAGTLASLRDRMWADGYDQPARVLADLVEITDDYISRLPT
jgi:hypothetical protein